MKQLILMRHAKSSWKNIIISDLERPLNKRGKQDAPLIGAKLKERSILPDSIISSNAVRTQKTARKIAKEIGFPKEKLQVEADLYCASSSEISQFIQTCDESIDSLMLIIHNPGITTFTKWVPAISIDNVPTAGLLIFDYNGTWNEFSVEQCRITDYIYPKQFLE